MAILLLLGSLLLVLSAKVKLPFWPVPMTMHVLALFFLVGVAGGHRAAGMMLVYLGQGAIGLPVFATTASGGIGILAMVGPTGGYLLGFLIAPLVIEAVLNRIGRRDMLGLVGAMLIGLGVVYVFGCLWLAQFVGVSQVLAVGVLPVVLGDLMKVLLAASLVRAISRLRARGE